MVAPYMKLPRCKRCLKSLVTERQEGWALCNEMMKWSARLTGNSSMKYWSNGPSSLLWTDCCSGCSWSLLGEEDAATIQIGIAYTDFWCLMGPGSLGSRWPGGCLEGPNPWFRSPPLLLFVQVAAGMNPVRWCKYLLVGPLVSCEMLRKEDWDLFFLNSNYEVFEQRMQYTIE